MKQRFLAVSLIVVAITALYIIFDPDTTPWMLRCPLFHLTGIQCPLCGAQRMLHALLNGHLAAALSYNAALLLTLPYWLWLAAANLFPDRFPYTYKTLLNRKAAATYLVAAALWMIVRNL